MAFVDLHLHSSFSDGSDSPAEIVARAKSAGASAIAITDHDTVAGVAPGRAAAGASGLGYLAGVEISTSFEGREVHVLGLGIDPAHGDLVAALSELCASRANRGASILSRLEGLEISLPSLEEYSTAGYALGRMHIARAMTDAGIVKKPQEAFDRFLNSGKPAYVPKQTMPIAPAIELIHAAGGLAFVAHPGLGKWLRKSLPALLQLPFDGIEAYHISHTPGRTEEYRSLARERGLLVTGGSDCHGTIKGKALLGAVRVPEAVYANIAGHLPAGTVTD